MGRIKSRRARNIQCKAHKSASADPVKDMGVNMIIFGRDRRLQAQIQ
jgi:hypothetical protein